MPRLLFTNIGLQNEHIHSPVILDYTKVRRTAAAVRIVAVVHKVVGIGLLVRREGPASILQAEVVAVAEEPHPKVAGEAGAPAEPSSDAKEAAEGLRSWAAGAQEAEAARQRKRYFPPCVYASVYSARVQITYSCLRVRTQRETVPRAWVNVKGQVLANTSTSHHLQ